MPFYFDFFHTIWKLDFLLNNKDLKIEMNFLSKKTSLFSVKIDCKLLNYNNLNVFLAKWVIIKMRFIPIHANCLFKF